MADVFISYAREDRRYAVALADAITSRGWTAWWDRQLKIGQSFSAAIETELTAARCVVVLWSRTSVTAEWVLNEASEGARRDILVPAILEPILPPLEFRRRHAADLSGWKPPKSIDTLDEFLTAVDEVLGRSILSQEKRSIPTEELRPSFRFRAPRVWMWALLLGLTGVAFLIGRQMSVDEFPLVPYRPPVTCTAATQLGLSGTVVTDSSSCSVPDGMIITKVLLHYTLDDGGEISVNDHEVIALAPNRGTDSGTVRLPMSVFTEGTSVLLRVRARNAMNADGSVSGTVYGRASLEIFTRPRSIREWLTQK